MKNMILALSILAASCGTEKHARSELSAGATYEDPNPYGLTDRELFFSNAKYTGYQPALSGESLGEPCSVLLIYGVGDIPRKDNYFSVTVWDQGQTPLTIDVNEGGVLWYPYFDYEKGKAGKYSFREWKGKTTIEWNESQIIKVESTTRPSLLERWNGKVSETIVCQNLTRVSSFPRNY